MGDFDLPGGERGVGAETDGVRAAECEGQMRAGGRADRSFEAVCDDRGDAVRAGSSRERLAACEAAEQRGLEDDRGELLGAQVEVVDPTVGETLVECDPDR